MTTRTATRTATKIGGRRLVGSDLRAVPIHVSEDRSVRQYRLARLDGTFVASASWFPGRPGRPAGYQQGLGARRNDRRTFRTLVALAESLATDTATSR